MKITLVTMLVVCTFYTSEIPPEKVNKLRDGKVRNKFLFSLRVQKWGKMVS